MTDWTSSVGNDDKVAHNGSDFLPWFLAQMQSHDKKVGKRFLDFLDIHYYFALLIDGQGSVRG